MMQRITRHAAAIATLLFFLAFTAIASAAPLRILPPASSSNTPPPVLCLAELIRERLAQCKGVDLVEGRRATRVCSWLRGGTFIFNEKELWQRIQSYVALDAMIDVYEVPAKSSDKSGKLTVEVRIFSADGKKLITATLDDATVGDPKASSQIAAQVAKELKLSDADAKILAEVRIEEPAYFSMYYVTRNVWSPWPVNPYVGTMQAAARLPDTKAHWSREAAVLRAASGYLHFGTHGRQGEFLKQASSLVRTPMVRLLGTGHEDEANQLLLLERAKVEPLMLDLETVLMQIAKPMGYGKLLEGRAGAPAEQSDPDLDDMPAPKGAAGASAKPGGKTSAKAPAKGSAKNAKPAPGAGEWVQEIDEAESMKPVEKDGLSDAIAKPTELSARTGVSEFKPAQRLAAMRMLGVMASPPAIALFQQTSRIADPVVREATAAALGGYKEDVGIDLLKTLATDPDENVAFVASRSLWSRKQPPSDFRQRALATLKKPEPYRTWAAQALASSATAADLALLDQLAADESPAVRAAVHQAKFAVGSNDPQRLEAAMNDPETDVLVTAIKSVPVEALQPGSKVYLQMVRLANDPDNIVAQAALDALWPLRPTDPAGRLRFDLATAAPYFRHKAVGILRASKEPWAKAELLAACDNAEAHTRVAALVAITDDPAAARPALLKAALDPHLFVRLRAASLLATVADASQAAGIREALAQQKDRATRLYLEDALARAEGKPAPPPQPAANSVLGPNNISWLCPHGESADSPYQAYYAPSHGDHVRDDAITDEAKRAHDKGKAFFSRISPIGNPGTIMVDGLTQDSYWRYLDDQLDTPSLPYIDGVVYGEESMSMETEALWAPGWRFFCDDLNLDAKRVKGDKKNLSPYESHAWTIWAQRRCVEGFNRLYDYTKLKFGKLHPGIQVCTFLPEQAGPTFADFEWKFDVGGVYHYIGHTRKDAFSLVRRYKTIWPDRPVLWLSNGIGVYERSPILYTFEPPTEPIVGRTYRAYTDALTAWLAGADTGWFSIWAFLPYDWVNEGMASLKGPTISPENITPEGSALRAVIEFAFKGVDKFLHDKEELAKVSAKGMVVPHSAKESKMDSLLETMDKTDEPDAITKKVNADKEAMFYGFQIYRKHLMDLARLFASLPRNTPNSDALSIQPGLSVWDGVIGSPGSDLLTYYDFLIDINHVDRLNLAKYKIIAVKDPGSITDQTIASLTKWLKETPGLLYVHLNLTDDNSAQYATPEVFDGNLKLDWPWEKDFQIIAPEGAAGGTKTKKARKAPKGESLTLTSDSGSNITVPAAVVGREFEVTGERAKVVFKSDDNAVLVVWRHPDFKGAVVFDALETNDKGYREELRRVINELKTKQGIGRTIEGPQRQEILETNAWIANTSAGSPDRHKLAGVDMLTGVLNPVVGTGKNAAFIGKDFQGKFAAAYNGVSVLCDAPIKKIEKIPGGIRIECDGLIQASSNSGRVDVKNDGPDLPKIKPENLNKWVLLQATPGLAVQATQDGKDGTPGSLTYIRSKNALNILLVP